MATNNYPAITGDAITERHARICQEQGHAIWIRDGIPAPFCPRCGDVPATPATTRSNSELLEAFNYGTRVERSGSDTGLDRIDDRYSHSRDLRNAAHDGYSLSAQFVNPKPYRDAIRAGRWSLDLYETVGGN